MTNNFQSHADALSAADELEKNAQRIEEQAQQAFALALAMTDHGNVAMAWARDARAAAQTIRDKVAEAERATRHERE